MASLGRRLFLLLPALPWLSLASVVGIQNGTTIKGQPFPTLIDATMADLVRGLESKLFTSVDLTKAYMARINEVNGQFNAVTETNPDALQIAADMDKERAEGKVRGPLHGIPVLLKLSMATVDRMNTTGGSLLLLGAKYPRDATVVAGVRRSGAVILGKANMAEWATFRSSDQSSSDGWSPEGGQCLGAFHPFSDPSTSSSGSAVAATLGLAAAALGTETDGSVISPAEFSSLVGIKPTVGLTSRHLVVPVSEHQDTVGTLAKTVRDAARLLQPIVGRDKRDNYTSAIPFPDGRFPDYEAAARNPDKLRGARLGVPTNALGLFNIPESDPLMVAYRGALDELRKAGAVIIEANYTMAEQWNNSGAENQLLFADLLTSLPKFFAELTVNPHNLTGLADLRTKTRAFPGEEFPERDTETWDIALDKQGYDNTDPRALAALAENRLLGGPGGMLGAIQRNKLDALVLPTAVSRSMAAIVGAPVVTVPLGYFPADTAVKRTPGRVGLIERAPNMPFGLAFLGDLFTEEKLIGLAYSYEQRTLTRYKAKPMVIPRTEIGDIVGF